MAYPHGVRGLALLLPANAAALKYNGVQISAMGVKVTNGEFWCFLSVATAIGAAR
jgi:hypothetical protein